MRRKDTLALKLERQAMEAQGDQDGTTWQSREQWEALRNKISTTLTRLALAFCLCVCVSVCVCENVRLPDRKSVV